MSPLASAGPDRSSRLITRDGGQPIPLQHVHVDAQVIDLCARVTVHQAYRNVESAPLEVVYVFPLDEGAAVCAFEATVDGVRYVGRAVERDEAFKQYDDALEAGHGGFLLDEERADVFTASLGNVKPGAEVVLSITYVTELAAEGGGGRFTLPTTVSPRYAPAGDGAGVGPTPAETLNPPVMPGVPYAFTFEMTVEMNGTLKKIFSPSHALEVEQDGTRARVRLAQRSAAMDRDLVVVIEAEGLDAPHATIEHGAHGGAVLVSFVPSFEAEAQAAEVVFVVDRSGSMGGSSIEEVRNALQLCLRSLSPGCRFNIVSFGSTFAALFPESRPYNDTSLKEAATLVEGMDADMGGTELLPALQFVFAQPAAEGLARQVLLLTDGEVTNTDAVIAEVGAHAPTARLFAFGIGAGASQHMVRGMARASHGAAEFISPGERIEQKVLRQFKRVFAPALTDAAVEWGHPALKAASDRVPPVFEGQRLTIYALAETTPLPAASARLTATVSGRRVTFDIPIDPAHAVQGETIATLAARERIRTLEEQGGYLESRGSQQRRARANSGAASEIRALGEKYQLCSRETSFVAIEHRDTPTTVRAELRRVPVALTSGWGGVGREMLAVPMAAAPMPASAARYAVGLGRPVPTNAIGRHLSSAWDGTLSESADQDASHPTLQAQGAMPNRLFRLSSASRRKTARPAPRPLDRLVALQLADGSWPLDEAFAEAVSIPLRRLERALKGAAGDADTTRRALATAVALAWLERHAPDARDEWEMLAEKAGRWLAACGAAPKKGQAAGDWLEVGASLV